MAALYCRECGGLLELDDDGSYWCSNCQNWVKIPWGMKKLYRDPDGYLHTSKFLASFLEALNDIDSEDDESEDGCKACGNPAYPKCKSSCPLFDD